MSECKPITGELRNWFEHAYSYDVGETPWFGWKNTIEQMLDAIDSIHANLERENESLKSELDCARGDWDFWESTHVELPKDADGVPIHIGDVLERGKRHGEVIALMLSDNPWGDGNHWAIQLKGEHTPTVFDSLFHRYAPTVEDVLVEMLEKAVGYSDAHTTVAFNAIAEYAQRLTLAGDAE